MRETANIIKLLLPTAFMKILKLNINIISVLKCQSCFFSECRRFRPSQLKILIAGSRQVSLQQLKPTTIDKRKFISISSEATLETLMSVRLSVCMSVCNSGLGGNVIFFGPYKR